MRIFVCTRRIRPCWRGECATARSKTSASRPRAAATTSSSGSSPDDRRGEYAGALELVLVRKARARLSPRGRADPGELLVGVVQRAERVDAVAERGDVEAVLAGGQHAEVELERRERDLSRRSA